MKCIGYWMENLLDEDLPLPQEIVGKMSVAVQESLCQYLQRGSVFEKYRGYSWCRFHCGVDEQEMGSREFTDGEWVWPEGLVHYVRMHSVLLPAEFIARAQSGLMVSGVDDNQIPSLDFWREWARQRQSTAIRRLLTDSLDAARAAESMVLQSLIEEVLTREVEGSDPCVFAGCCRRALVGRSICARHCISDHELKWRTAYLYRLPAEL